MPLVNLNFPLPPSANRLWTVSKGRWHRTEAYMAWLADIQAKVFQHGIPSKNHGDLAAVVLVDPGSGNVAGKIRIELYPGSLPFKTKPKRDLDNFLKPALDGLIATRIIEDDSQIVSAKILWFPLP